MKKKKTIAYSFFFQLEIVFYFHEATGDPKPKIQWDKDFDYLNISNSDTSRLNVLDNGTLYFTEVHLEDEGLYGCTIGSSAGLKREEAHLSVRRKY